jgi:hypothetical protein
MQLPSDTSSMLQKINQSFNCKAGLEIEEATDLFDRRKNLETCI